MKVAIFAMFLAAAMAAPATIEARTGGVCRGGGLYSNPQCCDPDILGLICLDGDVPSTTPRDAEHFESICSETGKSAKCCVIPVIGQAVLCTDAV